MKIATWNVNGIRARQAQVQEWIEREQPGRRLPAGDQGHLRSGPAALCEMEGYWCYWHGGKGYSGVGLHVAQRLRARAAGVHPSRLRLRDAAIVDGADVGDLDRRLDLRAERRQGLPRQDALPRGAGRVRRGVAGRGPHAGALRRPERRAHRHGRASERAQAARDRPAARRARAARADHRPADSSTSAARSIPTTTSCSPGGRRGATCGSATSAGGSTTCSPASALAEAGRVVPVYAKSERAITRRSWPRLRDIAASAVVAGLPAVRSREPPHHATAAKSAAGVGGATLCGPWLTTRGRRGRRGGSARVRPWSCSTPPAACRRTRSSTSGSAAPAASATGSGALSRRGAGPARRCSVEPPVSSV